MLEKVGGVIPATQSRWHHCPANGTDIHVSHCKSTTSAFQRNVQNCCRAACDSAFRLCPFCVQQGYTEESARVVDPKEGLCTFHATHGTGVRREKHYHASSAGYCETWTLNDQISQAHRIPGSHGRTGTPMHLGQGKSFAFARKPPRVISIDTEEVATRIRTLTQKRQLELLELVATHPDLSPVDMAARMGIARSSLDVLFAKLCQRLEIPTSHKLPLKREILRCAWNVHQASTTPA